jgi:hypothetical protein
VDGPGMDAGGRPRTGRAWMPEAARGRAGAPLRRCAGAARHHDGLRFTGAAAATGRATSGPSRSAARRRPRGPRPRPRTPGGRRARPAARRRRRAPGRGASGGPHAMYRRARAEYAGVSRPAGGCPRGGGAQRPRRIPDVGGRRGDGWNRPAPRWPASASARGIPPSVAAGPTRSASRRLTDDEVRLRQPPALRHPRQPPHPLRPRGRWPHPLDVRLRLHVPARGAGVGAAGPSGARAGGGRERQRQAAQTGSGGRGAGSAGRMPSFRMV